MIALLVVGGAMLAVAASLWRMHLVFSAPYTDPEFLSRELRRTEFRDVEAGAVIVTEAVLAEVPIGEFEHQLASADPENLARDITLALLELEHECRRWAPVPRVAARIASSIGFLGGAATLRVGLLETQVADFDSVVLRGIGVVGVGLAAALTCGLIHKAALSEAQRRIRAADALVGPLTGANHVGLSEAEHEPSTFELSEYMRTLRAPETEG